MEPTRNCDRSWLASVAPICGRHWQSFLAHDQLAPRPWEFALAAQSALTDADSPIGFLVAAFQAQLTAHAVPAKIINLWQAEAWHAVIQRRRHWQPLHPTDQSRANLAVEARIMVKDGEHYRFAHDLWRDFLAARYAARQPSAQEVVDDLIGLTDWPQILAWAIQSAWEDGRQRVGNRGAAGVVQRVDADVASIGLLASGARLEVAAGCVGSARHCSTSSTLH